MNKQSTQTPNAQTAGRLALQARHKALNGHWQEAVRDYTQAIALEPANDEYYFSRGQLYQQNNLLQQAFADYRKALALDKNCAHYYFNCGFIRYEQQKWQQARRYFEKAARLEPDNVYAHFMCAQTCLYESRFRQALEHYNIAVRLNTLEDKAELYLSRASALLNLSCFEQAQADLQKALAANPSAEQQGAIHYLLGRTALYLHQPQKAEAAFSTAIKLNPNDFRPYVQRAKLYKRQQKTHLALQDINRAMRLEPALQMTDFDWDTLYKA